MGNLAFYLFTGLIVVLWIVSAVNMSEFSEDGGTPFTLLVGSPIVIALVAAFAPPTIPLLLALVLFLCIAIRATFRLITNKDIGVNRTTKVERVGNMQRTSYRSDHLSGKGAIWYWTWQIVIPLLFGAYLVWFYYRMGMLPTI